MAVKIGILIPTRNRPDQISRLLESLSNSIYPTEQIVIVSSGTPIDEVLKRFKNQLNITHHHLSLPGQIRQKMYGLQLFNEEVDWVLFLDDDLVLAPKALFEAATFVEESKEKIPIGIGFNLPSSKKDTSGLFKSNLAKMFGLKQGTLGKVLRNGHANSYLDSEESIKTDWLNGASMWRRDAIQFYKSEFLDAKYSAYEDVIFSYEAGKHGHLFFLPSCELDFQEEQVIDVTAREVFLSATYWRYFFVRTNQELSLIRFFWSQIGRSLDFTFNGHYSYLQKFKLGIWSTKLFARLMLDSREKNIINTLKNRLP